MGPIIINVEKSVCQLVIAGNDDARQIEIYTPLKASEEVIISNDGKLKKTTSYTKYPRKAKEVKFSDFF